MIPERPQRKRGYSPESEKDRIADWLLQHGVTRSVFEPTGRYHCRLHQCLFEAGLGTALVNPLRSRRFAEALGQHAKNDRVHAMLARFGLLDSKRSSGP